MQLKIISKKLISPSSPTPDHLRSYKRSFFDQVAFQCYVPTILFYPHDSCHDDLIDNVVANRNKQLEESLSKVLSCFPPVAGRFADHDLSLVDCNDEGIPYVTAKVDCKLSDFLEKWNEDLYVALALGSQIAEDAKVYTRALAAVQVTFFECGGFGLFINTCHAVMDGFTSLEFIRAWAEVSCFGNLRRPFSFEIGNVFPTRETSAILKPSRIRKEKYAAKRFIFDKAGISELIDKAKTTSGGAIDFEPSRLEVITSLLWRALIRVMREIRGGHSRPSMMVLPINLRHKIGGGGVFSQPSANSFGTAVLCVPMKVHPCSNKEMELHDFVKLMRETKEKIIEACAKFDSDELFSMALSFQNAVIEWADNADQVDWCLTTGLCNFPIYCSDFGWGSPVSAHIGYVNEPTFWLYDTKCGKGVVAQVDLEQDVLCKFQEDPELSSYVRTSLASD